MSSDQSSGQPDEALRSQVGDLADSVETLRSEIQSRPAGTSSDDLAALRQQVADMADRLSQQESQIEAAQQAAQSEASRIQAAAGVAEIRAALAGGGPFADAVARVAETGRDVPQALSDAAPDGVATLESLRESYPPAARAALAAAVGEAAGDNPAARFGAFLRSQTGARPVGERDGDGPGAILSRAEARLAEGDLSAALDALSGLPQTAQSAMSGWLDRAAERADAVQALDQMTQNGGT